MLRCFLALLYHQYRTIDEGARARAVEWLYSSSDGSGIEQTMESDLLVAGARYLDDLLSMCMRV